MCVLPGHLQSRNLVMIDLLHRFMLRVHVGAFFECFCGTVRVSVSVCVHVCGFFKCFCVTVCVLLLSLSCAVFLTFSAQLVHVCDILCV